MPFSGSSGISDSKAKFVFVLLDEPITRLCPEAGATRGEWSCESSYVAASDELDPGIGIWIVHSGLGDLACLA